MTYDSQIGRFIVGDQDVNFSTHVSTFDIAVSKTSTPTSLGKADWTFDRIVMTEAGFDADYPGNFGFNHDAFVYTLNMFGVTGGGHTQVVSVSNADLLANSANPAVFRNDLNDFSVRPTTMHDSVAGDPMWLVSEHGDNQSVDVIKMVNPLSAAPTFNYTTVPVNPYSGAVQPRNPNGTVITDKTDSRILNAGEANNTLVATHIVSLSSTQDVAQWYSINVGGASPTLNQQGRVSYGPKTYVYYPSIDINPSGTIGMTFMKSGNDAPNDYMSVFNTGRLPGDPINTMEPPVIVPAGTGSRNYSDFTSSGSAGGRAGDLSGISIDPINGTFWSVNEFANTEPGANWGTAVSNFRIINPLPPADMAVTVTGPSSVDVSSGPITATYTITVTNNGPNAAHNVVLNDALPNGSVYVSMIETTGSDPYTIVQSGGTVTATATADIAPGTTDVFTLVVTAPTSLVNGAAFSDTGTITADNPDPVPANNTSTAAGIVINANTPAGIVTLLSGPASGNEGDFVTYNITVSNTGPGAASNATISDTLNPNLTFKSASVSTGTFTLKNGVLTFNIGALPVGATITATINAQDTEAGALSNNVVVSTSNPVGNPAFAIASVVTFFNEGPIVVSAQLNTTSKSVTNYLAASFTHANAIESASSFVASISWGDGTISVGTVSLSGTAYFVTGSHVYATAGKHTSPPRWSRWAPTRSPPRPTSTTPRTPKTARPSRP